MSKNHHIYYYFPTAIIQFKILVNDRLRLSAVSIPNVMWLIGFPVSLLETGNTNIAQSINQRDTQRN